MKERGFAIRRFEASDKTGIVELFRKVFGENASEKWWEWKYLSNPAGFHGGEGDIWIAEDRAGKIIGHWGVIPQKMKLGSQTAIVAQAVDAVTDANYQGQGIFRSLVTNVCSEAKKRYSFIFGFPNELYKGYEKLGWQSRRLTEFLNFINYELPLRSYFKNETVAVFGKVALKTLRMWGILATSFRFRKPTGDEVEIAEVEDFPIQIEEFWKKARSEYAVILERDQTFLNWRFSERFGAYRKFIAKSIKTGETTGYIVTKKTAIRGINDVLDIVDVHSLPDEDKSFANLVRSAVAMARNEGINVMHSRVPLWHKYSSFLRKLGFVPVGKAFEYVKLYQPRLIVYPLDQEKSIDTANWFYAMADTDYA